MSKSDVRLDELKEDAQPQGKRDLLEIWDLYRNQIIIGVVGLVLIIIAARFAVVSVHQAETNRWGRLNTIHQMYSRSMNISDESAREEQLAQVLSDCQTLASDAPKSVPGREALFIQGRIQLFLGDFDKAIASFEEYIALAQNNDARAAGQLAVGIALADRAFMNEASADFEKAEVAFEAARKLGQTADGALNAYGREAVVRLGILNEQAGNQAEAIKHFEEISALPSFDQDLARVVGETREEDDLGDERAAEAKYWRDQFLVMKRSFSHKQTAERYLESLRTLEKE